MVVAYKDYERVGQEFRELFIQYGGLKPGMSMLDIGCGTGRMAVPLTEYLSGHGAYWGFDSGKKRVQWCRDHIGAKFANFHFEHSDVYSKYYNPAGKIQPGDYTFPYENEKFDFVILISVFTHMLPEAMLHYMKEITRVLKPGGRLFATYSILKDDQFRIIGAGKNALDFRYPIQTGFTIDANDPESSIAYQEDYLKQIFGQHKLEIVHHLRQGDWSHKTNFLSRQDILVAEKASPIRKVK